MARRLQCLVEGNPLDQSGLVRLGRRFGVGFAFPLLLCLSELIAAILQRLLCVTKPEVSLDELSRLFSGRQRQPRRRIVRAISIQSLFGDVLEEGVELVKLLRTDRIKLMI